MDGAISNDFKNKICKSEIVKELLDENEGRPERNDIWLNNTCIICQWKYLSSEEKEEHSKSDEHLKRLTVYDFFSKGLSSAKRSAYKSMLYERYSRANTIALGLECIVELRMPFCSSPWWACSLCYVADTNIDNADDHIYSVSHQLLYIEEFYPNRMTDKSRSRIEIINYIGTVGKKIVKEQGKLESPEVHEFSDISEETAMNKLGIQKKAIEKKYVFEDIFGCYRILCCKICCTLLTCESTNEARCWKVHVNSSQHQKLQIISTVLDQLDYQEINNGLAISYFSKKWKLNAAGIFQGPVIGMQFLIYFDFTPFCRLCKVIVHRSCVTNHFSSENHLLKYLSLHNPAGAFMIMNLLDDIRRDKLLTLLPSEATSNFKVNQIRCDIPNVISSYALSDQLNFVSEKSKITETRDNQFYFWCPVCWKQINLRNKDEFSATISVHRSRSKVHMRMASLRNMFHYENDNFVYMRSRLKLNPEKGNAVWTKIEYGDKIIEVQKFADVGRHFLVDDIDADEVVCIACASIFPRSAINQIWNHLRTFEHLMQYLHASDREMLNLVKSQTSESTKRELLIDYLKCSESLNGDILVYSPTVSSSLDWGEILHRKVELSLLKDDNMRSAYNCLMSIIDSVANDRGEWLKVSVKKALQLCSIQICSLETSSVCFWCNICQQAFAVNKQDIIRKVWDDHLFSVAHDQRTSSLEKNKFEESGFLSKVSELSPTSFDHSCFREKITWKWNNNAEQFEYVYSILGLEDIVERHSNISHVPDFYCLLCASSFPFSQAQLDNHLRSMNHVINYLRKYHVDNVIEMELLMNKKTEKRMAKFRQFLADVLQNDNERTTGIRIYHPLGAQNFEEATKMQVNFCTERGQKSMQKIKNCSERKKRIDAKCKRKNDAEKEHTNGFVNRIKKGIKISQNLFTDKNLSSSHEDNEQIFEMRKEHYIQKKMHERKAKKRRLECKEREKKIFDFKSKERQIERNNRKSGLIREIVPTIFNHESLMLHRQHFETDVECRGYSNFAVPFMQNKKPVKLCDLHFNENNRRFEWEKRAEFFMSKYREMKTKESLIEFMWKQGTEPIPSGELPFSFNIIVSNRRGSIGLSSVYQVVCWDRPNFDSLYCSMCSVWITAFEMLLHLMSDTHRLNYFFRNYKNYHKMAVSEIDETVRSRLLEEIAEQVWKLEGSGEVRYRLRCFIDYETVLRIWPNETEVQVNMEENNVRANMSQENDRYCTVPSEMHVRRAGLSKEAGYMFRQMRWDGLDSFNQSKKKNEKYSGSDVMVYFDPHPETCGNALHYGDNKNLKRIRRRSSRSPCSPKIHYINSFSPRERSVHNLFSKIKQSGMETEWNDATAAFLAKIGVAGGGIISSNKNELLTRNEMRRMAGSREIDVYLGCSESTCNQRVNELLLSGLPKSSHLEAPPGVDSDNFSYQRKSNQRTHLEKPIDQVLSRKTRAEHSHQQQDPNYDLRKLLGVLVTLQQERERFGNINESSISNLYREMGITEGTANNSNDLLLRLCQMLGSDTVEQNNGSASSINFEQFGINSVKESSPESLRCVYRGAPDDGRSSHSGFGDVGCSTSASHQSMVSTSHFNAGTNPIAFSNIPLSSNQAILNEKSSEHQFSYFSSYLRKFADKKEPTKGSKQKTNLIPNRDIYATRRMKTGNLPNTSKPNTAAISKTKMNKEYLEKDSRNRKMTAKEKYVDYARRFFQKNPAMALWTGANNRANNTKKGFLGDELLQWQNHESEENSNLSSVNLNSESFSNLARVTEDNPNVIPSQSVIEDHDKSVSVTSSNKSVYSTSRINEWSDLAQKVTAVLTTSKEKVDDEKYFNSAIHPSCSVSLLYSSQQQDINIFTSQQKNIGSHIQSFCYPLGSHHQNEYQAIPFSSSNMNLQQIPTVQQPYPFITAYPQNLYTQLAAVEQDQMQCHYSSASATSQPAGMQVVQPSTNVNIAQIPVTQYSSQPTTYSRPAISSIYNPLEPNYGLPNTAQAGYNGYFGYHREQPAYQQYFPPYHVQPSEYYGSVFGSYK